MIVLALGAAALAVAAACMAAGGTAGAERRAARSLLAAAYLVPAALLALALAAAPPEADRLRFALLGLGFRGAEGRPPAVVVAGEPQAPEIAVEGSAGPAPRLARLSAVPPAEGDPGATAAEDEAALEGSGRLRVEALFEGAPAWVAVSTGDHPLRPVASIRLEDGDRLTFAGRTWTVERGDGLLRPPATFRDAGGRPVVLPRRLGELPLVPLSVPIVRPLGIESATWPLAWLEAAARTPEGDEVAPSAVPDGAAFLFFEPDPLAGGKLWLAAPPGSVAVERAGTALEVPTSVDLPAGERVHLLSSPLWDRREFQARGVRDRRSFRVETGEASLVLVYDTPEVESVSLAAARELALRDPAGDAPGEADCATEPSAEGLRLSLAFGDWQVTDRSLYLEHAPDAVAAEAGAILTLPLSADGGPLGGPEVRAATPRGSRSGRLGEPLWLGGEHAAAVQLDLLRPPLGLALLGLLLAAARALAARAARLTLPATAWAAAIEGLVALRLLVAYRLYAMPPGRPEPLELAVVAWALLPWSFLVALLPPLDARTGVRWTAWAPALAGWLASLAFCLYAAGGGLRAAVWAAAHLGALAVPLARTVRRRRLDPRRRTLRPRPGTAGAGRPAGTARLDWSGRLVGLRDRAAVRPVLAWSLAPVGLTLLRLGFLLAGSRESVTLGGARFAWSLVHVPLALALEAGYLIWLHRRRAERGIAAADYLPALSIVVFAWALPAVAVNDLGLALLNLPVFLAALAWVATAGGRGLRRVPAASGGRLRRFGRRTLGATPVLLLVLYLGLISMPVLVKGFVVALPDAWRVALESERNYLRLLDFANPKELARVARRGSEEMAVMSAVMREYTSGPLLGRGWFGSEVSPHLRSTAPREHVVAVFVAGEWGVVGAFGLCLLYAAGGLAAAPLAPWRGGASPGVVRSRGAPLLTALGALAALTLALPSLYMVLANYRLTLFTGKNAYLLGLDSTADVLEVFLLSLLVALGAAAARDAEGR